ncbi:GAF domain-containing sensor histidine kinase [Parvularcula oceani]|uniref:GAF domain-containing sensor histidine kinase n=1 Tax=Parvularcula oceani TaxID=1247963 RepID=UPI0004E1E343|nr:GAF domain-containing sensor histidine kinase [Parvularcula oceani]
MPSYPLPFDESRRQQVLDASGILEAASTLTFDRMTELAASRFGVEFAAVTLIDDARACFASEVGLHTEEAPRDIAFCAYTIVQDDLLVLPDTTADARFRDNPLVTGAPHIRFYAGAPLVVEGTKLGAFCILDTFPRDALTPEQERELRAFASLTARHIEAHWLSRDKDLDILGQLEREQRRVEDAAGERTRFVSLVSHELRTPLHVVKGFADLLRQAGDMLSLEEREDYLDQIGEGSERLSNVIESSLRFAAAEGGSVTLNEATVSPRAILEGALHTAAVEATEKKVRVEVEAEAGDVLLKADPVHAEQLFGQLIANAVKYSPVGGVVRVAADLVEDQLRVRVTDSGSGFSELDPERLVTPFIGPEPILTRSSEGLGLGLPLAYRLARLHGADMEFENAAEGGARVTVIFPAHRSVTAASKAEIRSA